LLKEVIQTIQKKLQQLLFLARALNDANVIWAWFPRNFLLPVLECISVLHACPRCCRYVASCITDKNAFCARNFMIYFEDVVSGERESMCFDLKGAESEN
jgi:hypothetical protein